MVPIRTMVISGGTGFGLGFVSSILVPSIIGFFVIFLGAIVGGFIGEIVSRVSGRKKSLAIAIITGSGFALGSLFFFARDVVEFINAGLTIGEAIRIARFPLWSVVYAIVASLAAGARLTW
jgi:ABC-type Mn2+/Zn2+ transport system permease subunit